MKTTYLPHMPTCGGVYYPGCTKIFTDWNKGNGRLGKYAAIDQLDSSMKEITADSKAKGKKHGSTCGMRG